MDTRLRTSRAFTLVEVVVALVLLSLGLLALAGAGAYGARLVYRGSIRERAATVARNRLEVLGAGCIATNGMERSSGFSVSWSAGGDGRTLVVVRPPAGTGAGVPTDSFRGRTSCQP